MARSSRSLLTREDVMDMLDDDGSDCNDCYAPGSDDELEFDSEYDSDQPEQANW